MAMLSSKDSRYKLSKLSNFWKNEIQDGIFFPGHVKKLKGLLQTMVAFSKHLVDLIFYFGPLLDVLATKYDLILYKMSLIFQLLNMAKFNKSGVFSFKMSSNFGGSTEYAGPFPKAWWSWSFTLDLQWIFHELFERLDSITECQWPIL